MSNTLTGLSVEIFESLDRIQRELVGFIGAVSVNANGAERAAVNQTIRIPATRPAVAGNITPAVTPPDDGDQTVDYIDMTITKARRAPFRWNGEERRAINNNGASYNAIFADQLTQAMRTLVNEMEIDVAAAAYKAASRAHGTAGTTPFGSSPGVGDAADLLKILLDNGVGAGADLQLVINTAAGTNLRKIAQLIKANEAATDQTLRRGTLLDLMNFSIRESAGIKLHTKGTGSSYTSGTVGAPYAAGSKVIPIITGSGTVLAGDVVTFAADSVNKYMVNGALAAAGDLKLGAGTLVSIAASNAMTIGGNYTPNVGFRRDAVHLLQRAPALPDGGDMASDRMNITDPVTGLAFELSVYRQYRQVQYEVAMAWGAAVSKSEFVAVLLG